MNLDSDFSSSEEEYMSSELEEKQKFPQVVAVGSQWTSLGLASRAASGSTGAAND